MKLLSFVLTVFLLLNSSLVLAYENKAYIEYNGVSGYWFDEPTADIMLKDLSELFILRKQKIPAFEEKITLQELEIKKYQVELEISDSIAMEYSKALEKSEDNYDHLEKRYFKMMERSDKWYRSPSFMFVVGIISGGLLSVGISVGLRSK